MRNRAAGTTERVSVSTASGEGNGSSFSPAISADGRYVVFASNASSLVAGDTNGVSDIFLRDRTSGTTIRVSTSEAGTGGNSDSYSPAISGDGRYVFFISTASNLNATANGGFAQLYRKDTQTGAISTVSVSSEGVVASRNVEDDSVSASVDGDVVAFTSRGTSLVAGDTNGSSDVFVHVVSTGLTSRVSVNSSGTQANKGGRHPTISADGRYVAFESSASNLVAVDTNRVADVFVHDRNTAQTTRISTGPGGVQGNGASRGARISSDGRYVVFESVADNLVAGMPARAAGDVTPNLFVFDRQTSVTNLASVATDGTLANDFAVRPGISGNGLVITFESAATNLAAGIVASIDVIYANVDQCPSDSNKRTPGVCGCGVADTDDDGDGVLLCNDACPDDSEKSAPGVCGCGVSDVDSDGSGSPDCIDPKFDTVPEAPTLTKSGKKLRISMEEFDSANVVYKWFLYNQKGNKLLQSGTSTSPDPVITPSSKLRNVKVYARNAVRLGGVESQLSPASRSLNVKTTGQVTSKKKSSKKKSTKRGSNRR